MLQETHMHTLNKVYLTPLCVVLPMMCLYKDVQYISISLDSLNNEITQPKTWLKDKRKLHFLFLPVSSVARNVWNESLLCTNYTFPNL